MAAALSDPYSTEFLKFCVSQAIREEDLSKDIVDACVLNEINAVTLSKELSDYKKAAEKLYLTEAEAKVLIDKCQELINNVEGGKDLENSNLPEEHINVEEETISARIDPKTDKPAPAPAEELVEEPESPRDEEQQVEEEVEESDPEANNFPEAITPKKSEVKESDIHPEPSQSPIASIYQPSASSSHPNRPTSAMTRGNKANLSRSAVVESSDSRWKSTTPITISPGSIPSYLRPTEAQKQRLSLGSLPSTPEVKQTIGIKRPQSAAPRIVSHTLLAPTQSSIAHRDNKSDKSPVLRKSAVFLESVLSSPQGQRVTRPKPFCLSTELRPKSCVLSREDLDLMESKVKAFKSTPIPKHVREQRPVNPRTITTPKKPDDIFEPFNLASIERRKVVEEALKKKVDDELHAEETARVFKALELTKEVINGEEKKKPIAQPVTKANGFTFKSEERIKYHHSVLDPVKKAKEDEQNRIAEEEARKKKEAEDLAFGNIRRNLNFKAGTMPDFSKPFKPDPSKAIPTTKSDTFKLATTSRLGEPVIHPTEEKILITDSNFLRSSLNFGGAGGGVGGSGATIAPTNSSGRKIADLKSSVVQAAA
mmetsp:Transcript_11483/g.20732  ORF Transcript_11483/g.20732 Transcript_11483/m.20732 type:complete len:596 (-) Transcript_11483:99-1886(-)|eukprot:CAMPEP_0175050078 /NCGR_PEP_ID=MMETSP0052_2-20121109/7072_1 /TAXON_ID=51329 ORGANISM="Polytomella parva, Strain SAG 63-3" /NCGR_SAMPLE_ID=MMETSP0052_2 /ASSEMBLY_ACC=CAM_ASM_000194 /LENGTH=595 /DNA_ID=CAMNT_0016314267 /DNA_START=505 /DNA_END=2292 /DNA_ORIENTATION=-